MHYATGNSPYIRNAMGRRVIAGKKIISANADIY